MQNKLSPAKVISRKTLKVEANFTNGFAQNVIALEDGTRLFIDYSGDSVTVEKTEPLNDPQEITSLVNSIPEGEA